MISLFLLTKKNSERWQLVRPRISGPIDRRARMPVSRSSWIIHARLCVLVVGQSGASVIPLPSVSIMSRLRLRKKKVRNNRDVVYYLSVFLTLLFSKQDIEKKLIKVVGKIDLSRYDVTHSFIFLNHKVFFHAHVNWNDKNNDRRFCDM